MIRANVVKNYACTIFENMSYGDRVYLNGDYALFNTTVCVLEDLYLKASHKHFVIAPNYNITKINAVQIRNSNIEVLTEAICTALPVTELFIANLQGLKFIDENAFEKCTKLEAVHLHRNLLTELPSRLFSTNLELKNFEMFGFGINWKMDNTMDMREYRLRSLPNGFFQNNQKLQRVMLANNQLVDVSFLESMTPLKSLTEIYLDGNRLSDVNVEKLYEKFPKLKTLDLYQNEFWCDRAEQIHEFLTAKNILTRKDSCVGGKDNWEALKNLRVRQRNFLTLQLQEDASNDETLLVKISLVFSIIVALFLIIVFAIKGFLHLFRRL